MIGTASGQDVRRRYSRSRIRHNQRIVSAPSAAWESVIEKPSPRMKHVSRTRWSGVTSIRVPLDEDLHHGERDDLEVHAERPALDVLDVELDTLLERRVAAESMDLSPARDPRFHLVAEHVARNRLAEPLDEDRSLGTRSDDAHLAAQDVHELRELVQAEAAQPGAERRSP